MITSSNDNIFHISGSPLWGESSGGFYSKNASDAGRRLVMKGWRCKCVFFWMKIGQFNFFLNLKRDHVLICIQHCTWWWCYKTQNSLIAVNRFYHYHWKRNVIFCTWSCHFWQLSVHPGTKVSSKWRHFRFNDVRNTNRMGNSCQTLGHNYLNVDIHFRDISYRINIHHVHFVANAFVWLAIVFQYAYFLGFVISNTNWFG